MSATNRPLMVATIVGSVFPALQSDPIRAATWFIYVRMPVSFGGILLSVRPCATFTILQKLSCLQADLDK